MGSLTRGAREEIDRQRCRSSEVSQPSSPSLRKRRLTLSFRDSLDSRTSSQRSIQDKLGWNRSLYRCTITLAASAKSRAYPFSPVGAQCRIRINQSFSQDRWLSSRRSYLSQDNRSRMTASRSSVDEVSQLEEWELSSININLRTSLIRFSVEVRKY